MTTDSISEAQCAEIRAESRETTPYQIAERLEVNRSVVVRHVTGECEHPGSSSELRTRGDFLVSEEECGDVRRGYDDGEGIDDLQSRTGRRWRTLVGHLTGKCDHPETELSPTFDKQTLLRRDTVTAADCERFREGVRRAGNVMQFAETVDTDYNVVLAHVNGECTHDVDTPPRESRERGADVDREECREIRRSFRSSPDVDFRELAGEYDRAETTIERHVKFRCTHPPDDTVVAEIEGVQDLLSEPNSGAGPLSAEEVAQLDAVTDGDRSEASQDLAEPDPRRVETTRSRIVRNTQIAIELKQLYDHRCQICGEQRRGVDGDPYAEAHHVRPLGDPHNGPDEASNVLVLCPNHHADFDYGHVRVDTDTYEVRHTYEEKSDGSELDVHSAHPLGNEYLEYHDNRIFRSDR